MNAEAQAEVSFRPASVVMKAVQARLPGPSPGAECAGKLGDDAALSKLQLDPRIPGDRQVAALCV